ncbi:hypothetical protein [Kocuria rhizophila]|uniref:hypothetical protein n=1 Tax=Kocuria rhizophila TaxID=72000 RepID=UPI001EF6A89F|nr:hypothetical protein [Kocuria rhizophila]
MSTHEPMTQERLDAIRARLSDVGAIWKYAPTPTGDGEVITVGQEGSIAWGIDIDSAALIAHAPEDLADLLAEVARLRHFESTVSWRHGDTTDGKTRDAMVEKAARTLYLRESDWSSETKWDRLPEFARESWRKTARAILNAALGTGEGA